MEDRKKKRSKEPWEMTRAELEEAALGGKMSPFGGTYMKSELSALYAGTKPVILDVCGGAVDLKRFKGIATRWTELENNRGRLFMAPIRSSEGIIRMTVALSSEAAERAAKQIEALKEDISWDARVGEILGYSWADICKWYLRLGRYCVNPLK